MPNILIDILPAKGHFYGALKLVLMLKEAGHGITYLNMGSMRSEMSKYNLESVNFSGFTIQPILMNKRKFSFNLFFSNLIKFLEKPESIQPDLKSFQEFVNTVSPDLVLLDEQNMLKAFFYEMCNIPVICIETKPEPCKFDNMPPFTSPFIPSNTFWSRLVCKWLWLNKIIINHYRIRKIQLNCMWQDHYSLTCRIARQRNINLKKRIDLKRGYGIGYKNIPRLIASPAPFDFPHNAVNGTHHIGPLVDIRREGEIKKPRYNNLINVISQFKAKNDGFVIYGSLGTITATIKKEVKVFFQKIIKVAGHNPDDLFVLSVGKSFNIRELFPVPENVYLFDFIPQVDLLQYCDVMITHGGMNSITECIFCEVPMLVYPLSKNWDQPGNSARVIYHRLGKRGELRKDSPKTISNKLHEIKINYKFYKKNILAMKEKFNEMNNSDKAIKIIENILNKS